jgi:uncharacterized protein YraI
MVNCRTILLLAVTMLLCAGCGGEVTPVAAKPVFFTATLPPTSTLQATPTISPPVPTLAVVETAEVILVEGMTTAQVNVRAEPSTASASLGLVGIFAKVQIAGRDSSGSWIQILYAESPTGKGWVRAEYVQVNSGAEIRPVDVSPASGAGAGGVVIQKVNARSGPGVEFELLGVLNPNDLVSITGRDSSGEWLQIEFAASPDGKGWVTAEFLQAANLDSLPVIGAAVEETPEPPVETAPVIAAQTAAQDGDSIQSPLAAVVFSATGSRALQVQGDVSAPQGDAEDWVGFAFERGVVAIEATCGGGGLRVELWNAGASVKSFSCGERVTVQAAADGDFFLRLVQSEAGYTAYTLTLEISP